MSTAITVRRTKSPDSGLSTTSEARERQTWLRAQDRNWVRVGKTVQRGIERRDYKALGYKNAREWMKATIPNSISWIYAALKAVKVLHHVSEKQLEQLPREAAIELTRLPEKERRTPEKVKEWVERALAAPKVSELRKEVNVARGTPDEPMMPWHLVLPESVYEELKAAESKIAGILALDIEADRKLRIVVWARIATLINTTEEQELITAMTGGS